MHGALSRGALCTALCAFVVACGSSDAPAPLSGAGSGAGGASAAAAGASSRGSEAGAGDADEPHVFSIQFDYRFDTRGFFAAPERKAALEAAAKAWAAVLDTDFLPVPASVQLTLKDPEDRDRDVSVDGLDDEIDDLLVFVGTSEDIPGYGRGGPSPDAHSRDETLNSSFEHRMNGKSFQPWAGSITFKGSADYCFRSSDAEDVPAEQFDFLSLATHELGHVLGFSSSPAFNDLVQGTTFTGKAAVAAYGKAVPLTDDLAHLADGTKSGRVEALMTPNLAQGIAQRPTPLDLASLHDIGYALKE